MGNCDDYLVLNVLAADQGDCLVLDYGNKLGSYRIVVDLGVPSTYKKLKRLLDAAPHVALELLVVSHIDCDHIGGASALMGDDVVNKFKDIWFNGQRHLFRSYLEPFGVAQGDGLTASLEKLNLPWNRAFGGGAVCLGPDGSPITLKIGGGAAITLLSPAREQLERLAKRWSYEVNLANADSEVKNSEILVPDSGLERLGSSEIDLDTLARSDSAADRSVPNGSSIAFIFEFGGKSILFAADAFPDVLMASGAKVEHLPNPINIFKLSHHGSASNTSRGLLAQFHAETYVVSTNGGRHSHPDDAALARVVSQNRSATLVFNHSNDKSRRWSDAAKVQGRDFRVLSADGTEGVVLMLLPDYG